MEDAQVITLVRNGETDAFSEIVEHYQKPIGRYLYQMTGDYELSKDLLQDTFIKAYQSILKTNADISFKAWLYKIATNIALQHKRRRKKISFIPLFDDSVDLHNFVIDNSGDHFEEKLAIAEILLKIPQEQRVCMILHFVEGFKYREIAVVLDISEEAVRKRVARGSKEFKRLYGKTGGEK
ncbi:MAG: RNA polymerase sigma factor [Peptococcaceae bacterium]